MTGLTVMVVMAAAVTIGAVSVMVDLRFNGDVPIGAQADHALTADY